MQRKLAATKASRKASDGITDEIRALAAAADVEIPEGTTIAELRSGLAAHFAQRELSAGDGSRVGEAMRESKRARDNDRVRWRKEPPKGYRYSSTGWLEEIGGPTLADVMNEPRREIQDIDRWMAGQLQDVLEGVRGSPRDVAPAVPPKPIQVEPGRGYQMTPAGIVPLDEPISSATPQPITAPVRTLDRIRRAYFAAFGRQPEDEWKYRLRLHVEHALHNRQGRETEKRGGKTVARDRYTYAIRNPETGKVLVTDAAGMLGMLRMTCPPGTVPRTLTAKDIENVLATATLGRGGGNNRAKRRTNVETALAELFARIDPPRGVM